MTTRTIRCTALALALIPLGPILPMAAQTASGAQAASPADANQWKQDLAAWRAQRERELSAPDGWLTLAGLEWLKPGINSLGSAADNRIKLPATSPAHLGLITLSGKTVQLLAPFGGFPPELKIGGSPAREGTLAVEGARPSTIVWRGLSLVVLDRGGRYVLRIKDANAPTRTAFRGLHWYAPDPRFRFEALWIPYNPPHVEKIPTVLGTTLDLPAPGVAEFTLDDKPYRLEPVIESSDQKTLFFILRDETGKTATYQAARFLHTGLPSNGLTREGLLTLDFNRLENPPCAYTNFATCPLPPEQNRLPVALEAGERRYEPWRGAASTWRLAHLRSRTDDSFQPSIGSMHSVPRLFTGTGHSKALAPPQVAQAVRR